MSEINHTDFCIVSYCIKGRPCTVNDEWTECLVRTHGPMTSSDFVFKRTAKGLAERDRLLAFAARVFASGKFAGKLEIRDALGIARFGL